MSVVNMYSYNGTILPELPINLDKYKVLLLKAPGEDNFNEYSLDCSTNISSHINENVPNQKYLFTLSGEYVYCYKPDYIANWVVATHFNEYSYVHNFDVYVDPSYPNHEIVWTNFDLINCDGTLLMKGTQPIPVSKPVSPIVNNRSFKLGLLTGLCSVGIWSGTTKELVAYMYNDVRLPPLPEWDKSVYPYSAIITNGVKTSFNLLLSKTAVSFKTISSGNQITVGSGIKYTLSEENPYWSASGSTSSSYKGGVYLVWANHNVYKTSSTTIYLAASDPIPVYEMIEPDLSEPDQITGYTVLEYIETDGSAHYIDTGFIPNQDTRVVCEFMFFSGSGIFGARATTTERNFLLCEGDGVWQSGYNSELCYSSIPSDMTNWHVADFNKNNLYIDGVLGCTHTYAEFTAPRPIILGGINGHSEVYLGACRYKNCKIYDNDTLVRDLIAVVDQSGNIGMYDKLNNVFYGFSTELEYASAQSTIDE